MRSVVVLCFFLTTFNLNAQEPGARAMGFGRSYNAIADDNSAIELNPGGMAQSRHYEIDINYAFSQNISNWRFSILDSLSSPLAVGLSYSMESFKEPASLAEIGAEVRKGTTTVIALGGGSDFLYLGANAQYNFIKDSPRDYFWTFTVGAILKPVPNLLNLSFTIYNFATAGSDGHEVLRRWSAGASTSLNLVRLSFEWSKAEEMNDIWGVGAEGFLPYQLSLLAGYFRGKTASEEGVSAGFRWYSPQFSLNYSFQKRYAEDIHSVSFSIYMH